MQSQSAATPVPPRPPLCVDLDGTLIRGDLLWESLFQLAKHQPLSLFKLPLWLRRGKAYFKARIAERVEIDPAALPYSPVLIRHLEQEKAAGRELVLATASNERLARKVAEYLGLFDRVLASDETTNLAGPAKRERLLEELGDGGFDYAANAPVDLAIWANAAEGLLVNPLRGVESAARSLGKAQTVLRDPSPGLRMYLKAIRVHQWAKNLLVFVPLIMAHQVLDPRLLSQTAIAFLIFSFCASSVYLLNDLLDLPQDRRHPTKRYRPLAAGDLAIPIGVALMTGLLGAAFMLALLLPAAFLGFLVLYYVTTLAYSFRLKQAALIDVLVLAALYTLRILAGAAAVAIEPSFWLLAFSMFLFLSLALAKRYSELLLMQAQGQTKSSGRGYDSRDLDTLSQLGMSSGYLAVLVMALYISSEQVRVLYSHPEAIWLLCPILLYWISRVWLLARRDELHEDPVVFAIKDRRSHLLALISALVLGVAI